jgi:hypothetical protein
MYPIMFYSWPIILVIYISISPIVAFLSIVSKAFSRAIGLSKAIIIIISISISALVLVIYKCSIKEVYISLIGVSVAIILIFVFLLYYW